MWTKGFWKGVAERMIRAFFTSLGAIAIGIDLTNVASVPWERYLLSCAVAALISLCISFSANAVNAGPNGSASLVFDRPNDKVNKE